VINRFSASPSMPDLLERRRLEVRPGELIRRRRVEKLQTQNYLLRVIVTSSRFRVSAPRPGTQNP
jgi:hypothetical protein